MQLARDKIVEESLIIFTFTVNIEFCGELLAMKLKFHFLSINSKLEAEVKEVNWVFSIIETFSSTFDHLMFALLVSLLILTKSELDEIEGIGPAKKQALLRRFGSVENIKKASLEEIMQVKGINEELAKKILSIF